MAENDNAATPNDTQDTPPAKKGGGLLGLTTGAVAGYGTAAVTAKFVGKPSEKLTKKFSEAMDDKAKAKTALETHVQSTPVLKAPYDALNNAKAACEVAKDAHLEDLSYAWGEVLKSSTAEKVGKVSLAGFKANINIITKTDSGPAGKYLTEAYNHILAETEKFVGSEAFTKLPSAEAMEAFSNKITEIGGAYEKAHPAPKELVNDIETLMATRPQSMTSAEAFAAAAKADPELEKQVFASTEKSRTAVKAASDAVDVAQTEWDKVGSKLEQTKALKAAEKKVSGMEALEKLNKSEGFGAALKRPFALMGKAGTMGTKLLIAVPAVAIGAIAYIGVKAMRNRSADEGTHVDRLEQQRGATPEAGRA